MSLPGSILMISGDHHLYLDKVFDYFGYDVIDNERSVKSWQDALDVLSNWMISQTRVLRAVCIHQGWTIILDPELVMYDDEEVCGEINRFFQRQVFGSVYQE